ncbi:MAG: response regulator, partial [Magnetococcales bacterium]|nr:response regulator [Magnetococcales bacterium]
EEWSLLRLTDLQEPGLTDPVPWRLRPVSEQDVPMRRKDGRPLWVRLSISLKSDASGRVIEGRAILLDRTERKEAEESLRQYEAIVAASKDHMAFLDRRFVYRAVNRAYLDNHGREYHEIVGHAVPELLGEEMFARIRPNLDRCLAGETVNYQDWFDFPVSGRRWMDVSYFPQWRNDGQVGGIVVSSRDITDRKAMEDELRRSEEEARRANRSRGAFLANMSHEIRTPMNSIIGMGYLALQTDLTRQQRDYLERIHASSNSLLRIINDILDFSKIDAGKLELETAPFDLYRLVEQVADGLLIKARQKPDIEILIAMPTDIPRILLGDATRLGQVLNNLCDNALKFTQRGEIVLSVTLVRESPTRVTLAFEVRDTGIGIAPDQAERLFQPFQQADSSTTRKYGGTGLGLAICRKLVELMGGGIDVESRPDHGSRFHFQCPFDSLVAPEKERYRLPEELRSLRALVVDDNTTSREILQRLLSSWHLDNTVVDGGTAALREMERAAVQQQPYGLLLLDWSMPELDGIETALCIRENPALPFAPLIILVSAFEREEVMAKAAEADIQAFLPKPVNPSLLFDTILELFGKGEPGRETSHYQLPETIDCQLLEGRRLLVVDDLPDNSDLIREILERKGLIVTLAGNGQEAVDLASRAEPPFDAVLTDVQMPVMDGMEATRAMRRLPSLQEMPIIAMTASAMSQDVEACLASGMNDHLPKPIDVNQLLLKLIHWITARNQPLPEGSAPSAHDGPHPPGLMLDEGLARCEGNETLYARLIGHFLAEFETEPARLGEILRQGDATTALQRLHKMKGAAATIAARQLADQCDILETALRFPDHPLPPEALLPLEQALEPVLSAARDFMARAGLSPRIIEMERINPNELLRKVTELGTLLHQGDLRSEVVFEEIRQRMVDLVEGEEVVRQLEACLGRLDTTGALERVALLKEILERTSGEAHEQS